GAPIASFRAKLAEPAWRGWRVRLRPGEVLLLAESSADPDRQPPPTTTIDLAAREPGLALPPSPPAPPDRWAERQVVVPAATAVLDVDFTPIDMTLEVSLKRSGPASAQPVVPMSAQGTARGQQTDSAPLTRVAPGLYRSQPRAWLRKNLPYSLVIDGDVHRRIAFDYTHPVTRLRVIDP
ncbi:MAG: hypothetical protein M3340_12860, partial [Actinomycetota bacterium]|nr:hypothetical protein [Actinomycetota bacterium]